MNLTKHGIAWIVCMAFAGGAWAAEADSAAQSAPAPKASKRPEAGSQLVHHARLEDHDPDERKAYRDKVHATQSLEECRAFVHDNYQQMAERAKAAGKAMGSRAIWLASDWQPRSLDSGEAPSLRRLG